MEYTIRHIHKKDREAVEKICIATGPAQAEASAGPEPPAETEPPAGEAAVESPPGGRSAA